MAQQIKIELLVDDKGTATIANFAGNATASLERAKQSAGGFADTWQGMTVGISAAINVFQQTAAAFNAAVAYMNEGAQAMRIESSFRIVAESAGINSERLIESMGRATRATIDDSDMMQKAVKLMLLGYDASQIERFSNVVITASQYAGTTAAEAYDRLADAIGNRTPKAMVQMGAVTRDQMAVVTEAIGAGADSMVLFELAMANLEYKQLALKGTQDEAIITLEQLNAKMGEVRETIGKGLIVIVDAAFRSFQYLAAGVLGLVSAYANYRALVYSVMGDEINATKNREIANTAWGARNELVKEAGQAIGVESAISARASSDELTAAKARIASLMEQLKTFKANKDAEKELAKTTAAALLKADDDYYDSVKKLMADNRKAKEDNDAFAIKSTIETEARRLKEWEKSSEEYSKILADEVDFAATENQRAINKIIQQENTKLGKLYELYAEDEISFEELEAAKLLISTNTGLAIVEKTTATMQEIANINAGCVADIKGYEKDQYDTRMAQIQAQSIEWANKGGDMGAISAWMADQEEQANIRKGRAGDDFFAGMQAGYLQLQRDAVTWGEAGYEIFQSFATNAQNTVSDVLFDGMKGKMTTFQEYWTSFSDALLRTLTNMISQMIVQWGLYYAAAIAASAVGIPNPMASPGSLVVPAATTAAVTGGSAAATTAAVTGGSAAATTAAVTGSSAAAAPAGSIAAGSGSAAGGGAILAGSSVMAIPLAVGLLNRGSTAYLTDPFGGWDYLQYAERVIEGLEPPGWRMTVGTYTDFLARLGFYYDPLSGNIRNATTGQIPTGQDGITNDGAPIWTYAKNGLDYVPYDNFKANLHKGERVQTAREATDLSGTMQKLEALMYQTAKNTAKMAKVLKSFDGFGMPAERVIV